MKDSRALNGVFRRRSILRERAHARGGAFMIRRSHAAKLTGRDLGMEAIRVLIRFSADT